ncbi:hypothetical protein ASPZODRAFT_20724 [Penicilliopsis zonata CBS 506.65]|uniref:Uncharacterized protein n=1 Tax=Penicilliopsis zonata CBS 506.65 TaxID=1073090 RepID=A0A1L9S4T6_9EURO|nr:hypothetical protein ASPZODRAFT_20724 [Penicilliopsis zonata CBS 506.65]OJJ42178.1 hypothetical protein ASPZODRAFT_20724 [Penicilliopsis zonata CBS 506.65]
MAFVVPTSSQWVTFPISPKAKVVVSWSEGTTARSNTYYVTKCYWGEMNGVDVLSGASSSLPVVCRDRELDSVEGESKIFIAAEFVEPQFTGGPLKNFHLRSLRGHQSTDGVQRKKHGDESLEVEEIDENEEKKGSEEKGKDGEGVEEENEEEQREEEEGWITMRLDQNFQYGQNQTIEWNGNPQYKWRRWIVYHPAIVSTIPLPRMFQHRFTGAVTFDLADAAIDTISEAVPDEHKTAGAVAQFFARLFNRAVKQNFGHLLRFFLPEGEVRKIGGSGADRLLRLQAAEREAAKKAMSQMPAQEKAAYLAALEQEIELVQKSKGSKESKESKKSKDSKDPDRLALEILADQTSGHNPAVEAVGQTQPKQTPIYGAAIGANQPHPGVGQTQPDQTKGHHEAIGVVNPTQPDPLEIEDVENQPETTDLAGKISNRRKPINRRLLNNLSSSSHALSGSKLPPYTAGQSNNAVLRNWGGEAQKTQV